MKVLRFATGEGAAFVKFHKQFFVPLSERPFVVLATRNTRLL